MLLTRLPLTPKDAFDLHVLSLPPAFVLSQDQTLKFKEFNLDCHYIDRASLPTSVSTSRDELKNVDHGRLSTHSCPKTARKDNRRLRFSFSRFTCQRAEHHLARTRRRSRRVTRPRRPEGEGDLILMLSEEPRAALNSRSAETCGSCRDRRLGANQPPSYGSPTQQGQEHFQKVLTAAVGCARRAVDEAFIRIAD